LHKIETRFAVARPSDPETTLLEPSPGRAGRHAPLVLAALIWSGLVLVLIVVAVVFGHADPRLLSALACAAAPGLVTLRLSPRTQGSATERDESLVIAVWALGGGLAAGLTGGLAGPFGALCAAPLAVGAAIDRRRSISGGAALALAVAAVDLWVSLTDLVPGPPAAMAPWLSILAVAGTASGLGAGISLNLRRRGERLRASEAARERVERLLAEQPHLIVTVDPAGRVASAFGAAPPGLSVELLAEQGLVAAAHHPDRTAVQTALYRAATHGSAEVGFTPRAAMDSYVGLELRRAEDGRLVGTLRDASIQHARELSLEADRAEAENLNAGKSRFLANMSHELRTPLNAVLGFSDIMRQKLFGPLPERYAEYAQLIHESGGHLLDLINDVLDMSKIEAERYELALEVFDAREPVSAALRLVRLQAHEGEIALRGLLPPEPVMVEADRRALKQITLNLLSNALKFTPSGGSVTVTLLADGKMLELGVADTGVGVAPEDLKRLGRPFEQAGGADQRARGTGLGLSLVRAFAELHDGKMNIESALGEGTAVSIRLPVVLDTRANGGRGAGAQVISISRRS
jgi:cell cycle sensor histidine kinase DivJ